VFTASRARPANLRTIVRFDEAYVHQAIEELKARGIAFAEGLDEPALSAIERAVGAPIPPELRLFWQIAMPTGERFPHWGEDPEAEAEHFRAWIVRTISFDIEQGQFWHANWGPRPSEKSEAVLVAQRQVAKSPPMIRVYSHRFMTTEPAGWGNPVLSVWQAVDSIYYGFDLADYLSKEFKITRPQWAASTPPQVPYWGNLFQLLGDGN
jgi:hypothetical protein